MISSTLKNTILTEDEWKDLGRRLAGFQAYREMVPRKHKLTAMEQYMSHEYGTDFSMRPETNFAINKVVWDTIDAITMRKEQGNLELENPDRRFHEIRSDIMVGLATHGRRFTKKPAPAMRSEDATLNQLCRKYLKSIDYQG